MSIFDDTPDADPAEIQVTGPRRRKDYVDPTGDSSKKRKVQNFNAQQRAWFEKHGWTFTVGEFTHQWSGKKHDLFGCGDWLACHPANGIMLVQTCAKSSVSTRYKKIKEECWDAAQVWLSAGGKIEVHGHYQDGGKGSRWQIERRPVLTSEQQAHAERLDVARRTRRRLRCEWEAIAVDHRGPRDAGLRKTIRAAVAANHPEDGFIPVTFTPSQLASLGWEPRDVCARCCGDGLIDCPTTNAGVGLSVTCPDCR